MTDEELKKDLESKTNSQFFKVMFFKKDEMVYYRRSFDDLFIYYRKLKVTEKQLLKVLINAGFKTAVCKNIHKVVFFIPTEYEKIEKNGLWKEIPYDIGFSKYKTTTNTKYTAEYITNLYNQIKQNENKSK